MSKKRFAAASVAVLVLFVLLEVWYSLYANLTYGALAGTYVFNSNGEKCTLHLRADQTFFEDLDRSGVVHEAQGKWYRYGQAHVSFSSEFLKVSGQELNASGEAHGQFDKTLWLRSSLTLAPIPDGPRFLKNLLR